MDIKIHLNPNQPHQREHGIWLSSGFKRHGLNCTVTSDINSEADVHIVSGPHYAKARWQGHPRTIWLDKRLYKEASKPKGMDSDPCVSLGWLNQIGGRDFVKGFGKDQPIRKPQKTGSRTIFLADYRGKIEQADTIRRHYLEENHTETLEEALSRHDIATGYCTTALVKAGLEGLRVICKDERSIMHQDNWLDLLPYADWTYQEISNGESWKHLRSSLSQL